MSSTATVARTGPALNELSATEIAQKIAAGELTCEAVVRDCVARIAERDGVVKAWVNFDPELALAQARALDRGPRRGSASRRADRRQGHHRHVRHADRDGFADLSRPSPAGGCVVRRAAAPRRRCHPRQDGDLRIRRHGAGGDHQSAQSGAHAGRLVERLGRGGGRSHGAGGARHADRRLGAAAVVLLRHFRLQADLQQLQQSGREAGGGKHRHHRLARALDRRHRTAHVPCCACRRRRRAHARYAAAHWPLPHRDVGHGAARDQGRGRRRRGGAVEGRRRGARGQAARCVHRLAPDRARDDQFPRARRLHGVRMGPSSRPALAADAALYRKRA